MQLNSDLHRIAILMHSGLRDEKGKTGLSVLRYSPLPIVAVIDETAAGENLAELTGLNRDVPVVGSLAAALAFKPNVLLIGIAPSGGALPDVWFADVKQAVAAGLSVVNGLHTRMANHPDLKPVQPDQWVWDVRQEPDGLSVGSGKARSLPQLRVLTVGTDMAVGKMSTSIELYRAAQAEGVKAQFIATGQTGLMLGYPGIPLDSIRVDFASGAVEAAVMTWGEGADVVFVEGQGSLLNPASTATLPLIRGSQPTHLILVHKAGMKNLMFLPEFTVPPLQQVIELYETVATAGGTFHAPEVAAIALNTFGLSESDAIAAIEQVQMATGLPCTDVIRFGATGILEAITRDLP